VASPPLRRTRLDAEHLAEALSATLENELLAERASELGAHLRERTGAGIPPARFSRAEWFWVVRGPTGLDWTQYDSFLAGYKARLRVAEARQVTPGVGRFS
jgi:hypothetical protein